MIAQLLHRRHIFAAVGSLYRLLLFVAVAGGLFVACARRDHRSAERVRVDSLLILHYDSIFTHPAAMMALFRQVQHEVVDSASYYKLELFTGYCLYMQGHADSAFAANDRVLNYCRLHPGNDALEGNCWNHRFALLQAANQRDSAVNCLHRAYAAVLRSSSDHRDLENICINLACQYRLQGDLVLASRYYHRALRAADSLHSENSFFPIYTGLAQIYADLHNFEQAHRYFDLAEQAPGHHPEYDTYHFYNSRGNCYYFEERYPEALACFRRADSIVHRFNSPLLEAMMAINLGEVFTLTGQLDSARHYLNGAGTFFENDTTANDEVIFYLHSLQAVLALREGNLAAANHYLSLPYDPKRIGPQYIYLHNKRLMEYYARCGDYARAYAYRDAVQQYDDSLRNVRYASSIAEIDYRYSRDTTLLKRDVQIANNRTQLSRQRTATAVVAAVLLAVVLFVTWLVFYLRRKNERLYRRQLAVVTELRMENVRNRLSPHYLFNVLNSIMPAVRQYAGLSRLMQLFIDVLRGNLLVSEQLAVKLGDEIALVRNFAALRCETNPGTAHTRWSVDPQVSEDTLIPSMCIQIPVENALKYAFPTDAAGAFIDIAVHSCSGGIEIDVRDNGCGYDPGKLSGGSNGTGQGLKLLFRSIELLNSRNAEKMTFGITSAAGEGTRVLLYIPAQYRFEF